MAYTRTTWANGSGGGTPVSAANLNNMEVELVALDLMISTIAPATTLPGSPTNLQRAILVDSTTVPTYAWEVQWSSTASRWIYVGGCPAVVEVLTSETTTLAATYQDLATTGPSFTVPRAGSYVIQFEADATLQAAPGAIAVKLGAAATSLNDGVLISIAAAGEGGQPHGIIRRTLAASDVVKIQYQGQVAGANTYARRRLAIHPLHMT